MSLTHPASDSVDDPVSDLGPLAWVFDELRKSLEAANKALKRFSQETAESRGSDLSAVDPAPLRLARTQLHQVVGALDMVGFRAPALVVEGMEASVQRFLARPSACTEAAIAKVEKAGFALVEYLEAVLNGKQVSPVALFSQYRDVKELAGVQRLHPADLWDIPADALKSPIRMPEPMGPALSAEPSVGAMFDRYVLHVIKSQHPVAAAHLKDVCAGLAVGSKAPSHRLLWQASAAYLEAIQHGLLISDVYVKRTASKLLTQYSALARGRSEVSPDLRKELLFFIAHAGRKPGLDTPWLDAVAAVVGTDAAVDYDKPTLGRFDPSLLLQARKRVNSAKEGWSLLTGGDTSKARQVHDQFSLVADSLTKILPNAEEFGQSLTRAAAASQQGSSVPPAELGMEVATAILYLEAVMQDLEPGDPTLASRMRQMAARVDGAMSGLPSLPLESWMEDLYRRVSDRHTMGSVVGELKINLSELERELDEFSRDPASKSLLVNVPPKLTQMRGVLSVLGLDHASQAVAHMRANVEGMLADEVDADMARKAGTFGHLANNLSALSFLIDMLNYQPTLAKKLFTFDASAGELKPVMGRSVASTEPAPPVAVEPEAGEHPVFDATVIIDASEKPDQSAFLRTQIMMPSGVEPPVSGDDPILDLLPEEPATPAQPVDAEVAPPPPIVETPVPAPSAASGVDSEQSEDDELLDIFLEEAREVIQAGLEAVRSLDHDPSNLSHMTTLRRAFHTLKGSSRMVGLNTFGEAGWAMEQVMNAWLAESKPTTTDLRALCGEAMEQFALWVEDIAGRTDQRWSSEPFAHSSQAMRQSGQHVSVLSAPLITDTAAASSPAPESVSDTVPESEPVTSPQALAVDPSGLGAVAPEAIAAPEPNELADLPAVVVPDVLAVSEPEIDLSMDLFSDFALNADPADARSEPARDGAAESLVDVPQPDDVQDVDWDAFSAASAAQDAPAPHPAAALPDESLHVIPDASAPLPAVIAERGDVSVPDESAMESMTDDVLEPELESRESSLPPNSGFATLDEDVKVVGDMRIGVKLFNVFLNEADEWSRRLSHELGEWVLEREAYPVPRSSAALAHSLAGASGAVGFGALSDLARLLEHALDIARAHGEEGRMVGGSDAELFVRAAEEVRRLLHQFAAGFLKEPAEGMLAALGAFVRQQPIDTGIAPFFEAESMEPETLLPAPDDQSVTPGESEGDSLTGDLLWDDADSVPTEPCLEEPPPEETELGLGSTAAVDSGAVGATDFTEVPEPVSEAVEGVGEPTGASSDHEASAPTTAFHVPLPLDRPTGLQTASVDDAFDTVDTLDTDLFQIFEEEAQDILPRLGMSLRQWVSEPGNSAARVDVLRNLHTVKGSARLAGALRLGDMAHDMETQAERLGSEVSDGRLIEPLLASYDGLVGRFEELCLPDSVPVAHRVTMGAEQAAPVSDLSIPLAVSGEDLTGPDETVEPVDGVSQPSQSANVMAMARLPVPVVKSTTAVAVRVRPELLDRLVNQTGEVMITRSRMESELIQLRGSLGDLTGNLDRLRQQLRDLELQAESQMQTRMAQAQDLHQNFDPLEFDRFTRVQELTRMMAESVNDVATVQRNLQRAVDATEDGLAAQTRQTRELQRDLLRTRMVEFEGIADRLYRVVRQASKETGKQVRLDIVGGTIEMDRAVLDRMTPAFEHLLRNCVGHGIEFPADRLALGKPAEGRIVVELAQEGNDVSVVFSDDGRGLNLDKIREKAVNQGLIASPQSVSDGEAAQLIFAPGLTTATEVTGLSGRGIGMDVVRSEVVGLGGRVETRTQANQGTSFRMVLPLTTAVTQVVMLRAGGFSFGVPSGLVEVVRRVTSAELAAALADGHLSAGGESVPLFWAGALLQASRRSTQTEGRTFPVVIFRSASQRVALHVDEVLGNQEVVVKNLGPQLSRLPGLAAMTVLASGAVALIYNPVALAAVYGPQVPAWTAESDDAVASSVPPLGGPGLTVVDGVTATEVADAAPPVAATAAVGLGQAPLIMVVDDSITVRRVTQRLLVREGYRVVLASDGLQALEKLQQERPVVVLSDIEMPRMDGFDLARNIRADVRLANLPIVMITSRIAEKHREHARQLGVDHYLGKPYSEDELLGLMQHYCAAAPA